MGAGDLFVEPGELRAAATEVAAATAALEAARGALESAGSLVIGGIDHRDRADDKMSTFVRQWRSEYEIVGGMLGGFREILVNAADCYAQLDTDFATCLHGCTTG